MLLFCLKPASEIMWKVGCVDVCVFERGFSSVFLFFFKKRIMESVSPTFFFAKRIVESVWVIYFFFLENGFWNPFPF